MFGSYDKERNMCQNADRIYWYNRLLFMMEGDAMKNLDIVIAAIQYIESYLTSEKIDLDIVAKAVHYSKYYLHRIFNDTVGMTIHNYTLRRQLTKAAELLVFSNKPIMDIAIMAGFESQQAFSNAFKAMYKRPPFRYREEGVFYPLQLEYNFKEYRQTPNTQMKALNKEVRFISEADIPQWMNLVSLTADGFPKLEKNKHLSALKRYIAYKGALLMTENGNTVGGMMLNYMTGSIDFLAVHPLYRKRGIAHEFFQVTLKELKNVEVSTTTFREGDMADTGYRKALKELGFAEAELLTEFGYPTQRMVYLRGKSHE